MSSPDAKGRSLPQCGFGTDTDFDKLIAQNHFLFRVYTPKERSPFDDDTDPFFIAPRFNELVARSPVDLPDIKFPETVVGSYADVARHMDWTTKATSPYISTSFSFSWAIWEAVRRYHLGVKKDVEIAIIDAGVLGGRAATAVQLLKKSSPNQRDQQFWKWYRFSRDSQTVLVYGMVPRPAVLASIPLLQILRKMPSYFLRKDVQVIDDRNPLDQAAWDYTSRRLNYRQFCQDMTTIFASRSPDVQLRDTTGGAVRLGLAFLRPFFHRAVQDDFNIAISYLRTLAISISEWPGAGWVRDHSEVRQVVESMVLALGEELREKYTTQEREEVIRLRVVINGLEQTIKAQHINASTHPTTIESYLEVDSDGDFEVELEEADEPTLVMLEAPKRPPSPQNTSIAVLPRVAISCQTPITPPDSPRNSLFIPTTTITVPLSEIVSTSFSFRPFSPAPDSSQEALVPTIDIAKSSSTSPASPPLTPPPRSPVFKSPIPSLVDDVSADAADTIQERHLQDFTSEACMTNTWIASIPDQPTDIPEVEESLPIDATAEGVPPAEEIEEEETDHEDDGEDNFPSWAAMSSASTLSSPRSSIFSIDTLCETPDIPLKRQSIATNRSDSLDYFRLSFSPPGSVGVHSRTVSFSELLPKIPFPVVPSVDPSRVPLPPSPSPTSESLPSTSSDSPCLSTSACLSLSRSASPTPSISSTSSLSSLDSPTRPPAMHIEFPLPITPSPTIIPPKGRISLLSPLPEQEELEAEESDRSSIQSIHVGETASYIVTGFLVGAFLTLFLFSTQRRTLLYVT